MFIVRNFKGLILATSLLFLNIPSGHAAKFANQFIEFEAPPQWQCVLEGAEWVCQNVDAAKKREAIIVMAAKIRGEQDGFDQYLNHLKAPKNATTLQGKPLNSEVKYAKSVELNGQAWIDALHLNSELPGFYTRYLATIKEDIGILVTYSIVQDKYQEYLSGFEVFTRTLRVFRKPGGLNKGDENRGIFDQVKIPTNVQKETLFPDLTKAETNKTPVPPTSDDDSTTVWIIGGVAVLAYMMYRRRMNRD